MSVTIIAEIGINHNGDMGIVKKLIEVAKDAGCDAVKFQKRTVNKVYSEEILNTSRNSPWGNTQRDQKNGLELSYDDYIEIDRLCKSKTILWFASAWDIESQFFLRDFNCTYNKVASAMIVAEDFLEEVASEKKHTFISTGMCSMNQIKNAVQIFKKFNCSFELMHTVSTYPMPDSDANLMCIPMLKKEFDCNVGYSGHETGLSISYAAVALGATSIERHITLDRTMYGSDQAASIEPHGLRQLVGAIRKIEISLGDGIKKISKGEIEVAEKLRAHL